MTWRPIHEAPKDGPVYVIVGGDPVPMVAEFDGMYWIHYRSGAQVSPVLFHPIEMPTVAEWKAANDAAQVNLRG